MSPARIGGEIWVYSMTKFINGKNDCVAGAICGSKQFINDLSNVNNGTAMLLGPVLDPLRSASIHKNIHTLHLRIKQHSYNAMFLAKELTKAGLKISYPGLESHPQHQLHTQLMNEGYGYGGMLAIDFGSVATANQMMQKMQMADEGYLAVSL